MDASGARMACVSSDVRLNDLAEAGAAVTSTAAATTRVAKSARLT
jgi:hypothetical protein